MHGLTCKKGYFYALSFMLLAIMLYSMGEIVWRLSHSTFKAVIHMGKQDIARVTFYYVASFVLLKFILFHALTKPCRSFKF